MKAEQLLTHEDVGVRFIAKFLQEEAIAFNYKTSTNTGQQDQADRNCRSSVPLQINTYQITFSQVDVHGRKQKITFAKRYFFSFNGEKKWRWYMEIYNKDGRWGYADDQAKPLVNWLKLHHLFNRGKNVS